MQVAIKISDDLRNAASGVYMIRFSNGYFYIGATRNLKVRVTSHIGCIRSDFRSSSTAKGMRSMAGFEGEIEFILLESVNVPMYGYGLPQELITKEREYKAPHINSDFLLNRIRILY